LGDRDEQIFVGAGARQEEGDAPGVAPDHGADLQQLEADRANLGAGQRGGGQAQPPDGGEQAVAKPASNRRNWLGHQSWHEVRSANSSNCSLMRFSMSPRAIEILVERGRLAAEIGDDKARIGTEPVVLDPGDHPPLDRPGLGRVTELTKAALLVAGFGETRLGVAEPRFGQSDQPRVLGQSTGSPLAQARRYSGKTGRFERAPESRSSPDATVILNALAEILV